MNTNIDSDFIGDIAGSLRDWRSGLDPDPSGANCIHVSGCTSQLEFDAATSITTNGRIPISEGLQAASAKGKFQPDKKMVVRSTMIVMTMSGSYNLMKKGNTVKF